MSLARMILQPLQAGWARLMGQEPVALDDHGLLSDDITGRSSFEEVTRDEADNRNDSTTIARRLQALTRYRIVYRNPPKGMQLKTWVESAPVGELTEETAAHPWFVFRTEEGRQRLLTYRESAINFDDIDDRKALELARRWANELQQIILQGGELTTEVVLTTGKDVVKELPFKITPHELHSALLIIHNHDSVVSGEATDDAISTTFSGTIMDLTRNHTVVISSGGSVWSLNNWVDHLKDPQK